MSIARKLVLLAAMVFAAMALTVSSASATEVSQEVDDDTNVHCEAVQAASHGTIGSGGCTLHATNNGAVTLRNGIITVQCNNEFEARVDEAGEGYIYSQTLTNCSPFSLSPCGIEGGIADVWPVHANTNTSMEAQFCVTNPLTGNLPCHLPDVEINQTAHNVVSYSTDGTQNCEGTTTRSVNGNWDGEFDALHPEGEIAP